MWLQAKRGDAVIYVNLENVQYIKRYSYLGVLHIVFSGSVLDVGITGVMDLVTELGLFADVMAGGGSDGRQLESVES